MRNCFNGSWSTRHKYDFASKQFDKIQPLKKDAKWNPHNPNFVPIDLGFCRSLPGYAIAHHFGKRLWTLNIKGFEILWKVMQNDGKSAFRLSRQQWLRGWQDAPKTRQNVTGKKQITTVLLLLVKLRGENKSRPVLNIHHRLIPPSFRLIPPLQDKMAVLNSNFGGFYDTMQPNHRYKQ